MTCDVSVISVAGLVSLTAMAMPAHAHHEGDFSIGISGGPAPQLRFEFDPDILAGTRTIGLARSVNPAVPGWLGEEPGFEAMETDEPEGGLFCWVTCPPAVDTNELFHRAARAGVAYIPGSKFYPPDQVEKHEMRLNFSYAPADEIKEGVTRLARLLRPA